MGAHGVHPTAMKSPFSNWAGESDAESQMNQARLNALGKRRKSHKKIALEVVEEAEKEGEEGMTTHAITRQHTCGKQASKPCKYIQHACLGENESHGWVTLLIWQICC